MLHILMIPFSTWLNRVRGGGWGGQYLRGAPDFYVAPFYGLMAWFSGILAVPSAWGYQPGPIVSALIFVACWMCWSTPAWATIYRLDFIPAVDREGYWYEKLFVKMAFGNLIGAFFWRMTIFLIPMAAMFNWWWLALGPVLTLCYVVAWMIDGHFTGNDPAVPHYGIPWAEPIAGFAWGAALYLSWRML